MPSEPWPATCAMSVVLAANVRSFVAIKKIYFSFFHSFNLKKCIVHKFFMNYNVGSFIFFMNIQNQK